MQQLSENLWHLQYELKVLGADMQRHVAVMRLGAGQVVVHSTGPFTPADVAAINALGPVGWVLDVMLRHDTFSRQGREAFPQAAFLGPQGFSEVVGFPTGPLLPAPAEWNGEIEVLRVQGVPSMEEHAVFHAPSRTLIVADLFFDPDPEASGWTHFLMSMVAGRKEGPGISRAVKFTTQDKEAFRESLEEIGRWDFDRIIFGHGAIVHTGGKQQFHEALAASGF